MPTGQLMRMLSTTEPDMEKKSLYNIRYTMKPKDIMTFVSGLHEVRADMIECAVIRKEREGFPEANLVIKHIMDLK
jgi:hypothetical protein